MKVKVKFLAGFLALVILALSAAVFIQAADKTINDCHKFCAENYPDNYDLYVACMAGCLFVPE